jgi:hypothetical protein
LFDFTNRFDFKLPEERALNLTEYTNFNYDTKLTEPGSIEKIEKMVAVDKLKERVILNLNNPNLVMLAWTSNAGYALRHNMAATYEPILQKLEEKFDYEYKFSEILKIWFEKTQDIDRLKVLIENVKQEYLRWEAVRLIEDNKNQIDYLKALFKKIISDPNQVGSERIRAANHLMKFNDLFGFYYLTDMILEDPQPDFDFRLNLGSISMMKETEAIPTLIKLLAISKQPEFKKNIFNDLEEYVLSAFHSIGIQSSENYLAVKIAIEKFIVENITEMPTVNFLYFSIVRIEEQIKLKYTGSNTIDDALKEYSLL